jgi:hypothetical protein
MCLFYDYETQRIFELKRTHVDQHGPAAID